MTTPHRQVWRDMTLFDGHRTMTEPMAVVIAGSTIEAIYPEAELDARTLDEASEQGRGGVMTPGLIDCHTHLVFGGQRAGEFEMRLEGASYTEIANAGGGILSTVYATRAASENELFERATPRLQALIDDGVTTVEIKSGYGLTVADELKMLRVARHLGQRFPIHVTTTLLGAHAIPPEYKNDSDAYIDLICQQMIPAAVAEGLADAVDVFCETIAFSVAQCERVFEAAAAHGLPIKAHAEQLSNLGGTAAAARFGALSADHIEYLDATGVAALRDAGSAAVLLPGAFYTLAETQKPPVETLRQAGVPMSLATDANPGSSPLFMPTLMLNLGCTLFRLTPQEALAGMTSNAAGALGHPELGQLAAGAPADLCVWNVETPAELAYAVQPNRLHQRVIAGEITHG
ncbi:imidazolonepropionase [Salinisphaera sp. USBA-960]|uniref:imidazolonepropionase n=1 Tax=Salinisphaera orenii TaxID=856731 RepID=UPI000DBE975F|nr:imidazolonepropionase [Salifodinibacter halophilus]NNC25735.1 imidazolonepropionase [Salifodinibacter halophilus]